MINQKDIEKIQLELAQLEMEHAELDSIIDENKIIVDELTLQRIKKRRLYLKDRIEEIRSLLYPNIIA